MSESTYEAVFEKACQIAFPAAYEQGPIEGRRTAIRHLGDERLGPPDAATVAALEAVDDLELLREMLLKTQHAQSWREILSPASRWRGDIA